ncbi:MAG: hypothetical protein DRO15_03480 [Thermoprotei archaeon]|nr:MAG: hypothetical protein DRO15_03480 [Thermoprotei archaeon]
MIKGYGDECIDYSRRTPSMLPLSKFMLNIIKIPMKLLLKNSPRSKRDIAIHLSPSSGSIESTMAFIIVPILMAITVLIILYNIERNGISIA